MRISELAARTGVSVYALRWYESEGILPRPARQANRYRDYTEADVARVRYVATLRRLGVGADQAGQLASAYLDRAEIAADVIAALAQQRKSLVRQREEISRLEGELLDLEMTLAAARRARETLAAGGRDTSQRIRVLFVSNFNAARGPIAQALLEHYGGTQFEAASAGAQPRPVHSLTVEVLQEIGISLRERHSRAFDAFAGQRFDYVVTLNHRGRETCPTFAGTYTSLNWGVADPSVAHGDGRASIEAFRRARTELSMRLGPFIDFALRAASRWVPPQVDQEQLWAAC